MYTWNLTCDTFKHRIFLQEISRDLLDIWPKTSKSRGTHPTHAGWDPRRGRRSCSTWICAWQSHCFSLISEEILTEISGDVFVHSSWFCQKIANVYVFHLAELFSFLPIAQPPNATQHFIREITKPFFLFDLNLLKMQQLWNQISPNLLEPQESTGHIWKAEVYSFL